MLVINPKDLAIQQLHQYLIGSVGPRPICFASTVDADGIPNLAPFSFFNVFSANPPILVFAPNNSGRTGEPKHTLLNVKQVPEVVINVVTASMVEQMNVAAAPWDRGVSEFEKAGFTPVASELIRPFRVAESPSQIECKVIEIKELGQGGGAGNLVICEVLRMHIHERVLNEEGKIDQRKMELVGRLGGSWYSKTDAAALFELGQPMSVTLGYDRLPDYVKSSERLSANDLGKLSSVMSMPDERVLEAVRLERQLGQEWEQVRVYIDKGEYDKALALLLLSHE